MKKMTLLERISYFKMLLMKKFRVGPEPATDAVYQAFSEIYGKDHPNFNALWYVASRNKIVDYIRVKSTERTLEDWHMPNSYQDNEDEFNEIAMILESQLTKEEWTLFERLRLGQSSAVIAEETGVSEPTVNKYKLRLIRRCRKLLSVRYNMATWNKITDREPDKLREVEIKFPDGTESQGYRLDKKRWVGEGGYLLKYEKPVKWRPL